MFLFSRLKHLICGGLRRKKVVGNAQPDETPTSPAPTHADAAKGEEHSHHPSASECTPTPAVAGPPVLPATEDEHPRPAVVVPAAAPVVVQPPAAELPTAEEPMPPWPDWPDAGTGEGHHHDAGRTEPVPVPASAASAPPVIAEQHPQPAPVIPEAAPMAHHLLAAGLRTAYFAPAGYAGSDQLAVPFMAPDLRRRLGQASDDPEPPR